MAGLNVSGNFTPSFQFSQTLATGVLAGIAQSFSVSQFGLNLVNGVLADQMDLYSAGVGIQFTGTTPQNIDVTALTDIYGNAVDCVKLRGYIWINRSATDGVTLTVTPGASNGNVSILGTGSSLIIPASTTKNPGGGFAMGGAPNTSGYAVTSSTKILTFTPSATLVADLWFLGTHS